MRFSSRPSLGATVAIASLCFTLFACLPSATLAADTSSRTEADIQARWHQLMPSYSGSPYASAPTLHSPYAAGSLNNGFVNDGLNIVNYYRYLAGLPDDVTIDPAYADLAQHGSVLLDAAGFSHTPSKPADMDSAFYQAGYKATSSSNIGVGHQNLETFLAGCMDDDDSGNIRMLGHRRWMLNPPLAKTGFGYASTRSDMYVFDFSRTQAVTYDDIKWPAAGAFPTQVVDKWTPWSVTMNPSLYSVTPGTAGYQVTLTRVNDGKTWTFNSSDTDASGEYFNVNTEGYGVSNCIIFRPDPDSVGGYQVGDSFEVTITGPIKHRADGSPATISYRTDFVSQDGPATALRLAGKSSIKRKRTYTLAGTIAPLTATGKVQITLKRYRNGRWQSAIRARADISGGRFTYRFKPKKRGKWRVTVRFGALATSPDAASPSSARKVFRVN